MTYARALSRVLQPAAGKYGDKPAEDEMIDEDLHQP